jgi:hypothetical protein
MGLSRVIPLGLPARLLRSLSRSGLPTVHPEAPSHEKCVLATAQYSDLRAQSLRHLHAAGDLAASGDRDGAQAALEAAIAIFSELGINKEPWAPRS